MTLCISSIGALTACGGRDSSTNASATELLASGETCHPAWDVNTVYREPAQVSYHGINYLANFHSKGKAPDTNSGATKSFGQPWLTGFACGASAPAATSTPASTTTTLRSTTTTIDPNAPVYPFALPATVTATLSVQTQTKEQYDNLLLGVNISGFTSADEQALIKRWDPVTIRFPSGLWSNWYDWTTDQNRVFGTDTFDYVSADGSLKTTELSFLSNIKQMDAGHIKMGIAGLTSLNTQKKGTNGGKGYDMLWTFNMSADGT